MKRRLDQLSSGTYDLLIIGGGIYGAAAAWDAALRGLSVALVERGDFSEAASGNCYKFVHGGIRYLQHGDVARVRESSRERRALLRIAPHLVQPISVVVPTYGRGLQGKPLMRAALGVYDLLTADRNRGLADPQRRISRGYCLSRAECLQLFPGVPANGLTGAAVFHDAQMSSPARLVLAFLQSAANEGADVANYVEATGFLRDGHRVTGVRALDRLSGRPLDIRGRIVLNATGAWVERLLGHDAGLALPRPLTFSRDAYFIIRKRLSTDHALAVQAQTKDPDALMSRGRRHLFLAPWRDYTLVGVWHKVHREYPDAMTLTTPELAAFVEEINTGYPLGLRPSDVLRWGAGLTLFGDNAAGTVHLSYGKRSVLVDHSQTHGVGGLISLVGVRYTTARGMAQQAVDLVVGKLGLVRGCRTEATPVAGGGIADVERYVAQAVAERPAGLSAKAAEALVRNHGTDHGAVLRLAQETPALAQPVDGSLVIRAEVLHAVREEMAQTLRDVVFRRTDLGTGEYPGEAALRGCAELMAAELGWDAARVQREIEDVEAGYPVRTSTEGLSA